MFLKINVRAELLLLFNKYGYPKNAYKDDPLCRFLYYDYLNSWLPFFKKHSDEYRESGRDVETANGIVEELLRCAVVGICPLKYEKEWLNTQGGIMDPENFKDQELKDSIRMLDLYGNLDRMEQSVVTDNTLRRVQ